MTVLVTGGCGYIGAHVVHALHQAGEKVVVVDDLSYGKPTRIEGSRLYGMDIAAPGAGERLAEILDAEPPARRSGPATAPARARPCS